jgi:hypothetical protein
MSSLLHPLFFLLACALATGPALGQSYWQSGWDYSLRRTVDSAAQIQPDKVDTIAGKLGMIHYPKVLFIPIKHKVLYGSRWGTMQFMAASPNPDGVFPWLPPADGKYAYGFASSWGWESPPFCLGLCISKHYAMERFLMSAYQQEIDPLYRDTLSEPFQYPLKDLTAFSRRNWISSGYAMQYAYGGNPFYRNEAL